MQKFSFSPLSSISFYCYPLIFLADSNKPKSVIRGICFVVVNVIYRLTGSCKLKFLMTAIRSLNFQYAWFQHVTRNTTKMGFSNDRFGIKKDTTKTLSKLSKLITKAQQKFHKGTTKIPTTEAVGMPYGGGRPWLSGRLLSCMVMKQRLRSVHQRTVFLPLMMTMPRADGETRCPVML